MEADIPGDASAAVIMIGGLGLFGTHSLQAGGIGGGSGNGQ